MIVLGLGNVLGLRLEGSTESEAVKLVSDILISLVSFVLEF